MLYSRVDGPRGSSPQTDSRSCRPHGPRPAPRASLLAFRLVFLGFPREFLQSRVVPRAEVRGPEPPGPGSRPPAPHLLWGSRVSGESRPMTENAAGSFSENSVSPRKATFSLTNNMKKSRFLNSRVLKASGLCSCELCFPTQGESPTWWGNEGLPDTCYAPGRDPPGGTGGDELFALSGVSPARLFTSRAHHRGHIHTAFPEHGPQPSRQRELRTGGRDGEQPPDANTDTGEPGETAARRRPTRRRELAGRLWGFLRPSQEAAGRSAANPRPRVPRRTSPTPAPALGGPPVPAHAVARFLRTVAPPGPRVAPRAGLTRWS